MADSLAMMVSRASTLILPLVALVAGLIAPEDLAGKIALAVSLLPLTLLVVSVFTRYKGDPIAVAATVSIIAEIGVMAYIKSG